MRQKEEEEAVVMAIVDILEGGLLKLDMGIIQEGIVGGVENMAKDILESIRNEGKLNAVNEVKVIIGENMKAILGEIMKGCPQKGGLAGVRGGRPASVGPHPGERESGPYGREGKGGGHRGRHPIYGRGHANRGSTGHSRERKEEGQTEAGRDHPGDSVPAGGKGPEPREGKGHGAKDGRGPQPRKLEVTRDEARVATRAGFRPMELHMVWNPATKTWIPEGNLPAGLQYDDEELVPDYDDGMIDIQAAMEKQLMLACRMIRGMEQERDHLKGKMAEQGRLLERRNSTINQLLEQVRETQGQLREAQDQLADWRSWWDRWEWDGTRWRKEV